MPSWVLGLKAMAIYLRTYDALFFATFTGGMLRSASGKYFLAGSSR
jgi:hypothetical protein